VTEHAAEAVLPQGVALERRGRRRRSAVPAVIAALVLVSAVVLAFVVSRFTVSPNFQALGEALQPPRLHGGHPLGTDALGADLLSRLASGLRTSLVIGLLSVFFGGVLGITIGTLSGYASGRVDEVIMRVADVQLAIPAVLLAMTLVSILRPSTDTVILVLSLYVWVVFARVARAQVLAFRRTDVVIAM